MGALVLATAVLAGTLGAQPAPVRLRSSTLAEDLQMFSQVFHQIRLNHADSIDSHRLLLAAIEGMLQAADPHSYALPAARLAPGAEDALAAGKLVPLPVTLAYREGIPVVLSVSPGSRASTLDILRGDELLAVDGQRISARSAPELEIALAGPKGSAVVLTLRRIRSDGSTLDMERRVSREWGGTETPVPSALLLTATVGYIRVTTFDSDRVEQDLHASLDRLETAGMERLILDLRDNGGGSVEQARRVAGAFLAVGSIVYILERRNQNPDTARVSRANRGGRRSTLPLVVLVNRGTASASELVAGALQDHDRALLLGQPTFGKSLVMERIPLADGSRVVLVTGRLRSPCGRIIQREYRDLAVGDYYRRSESDPDTTGTPACVTPAGRRLFAGGGIIPDRWIPDPAPPPLWVARLLEAGLAGAWAGGFLSTQGELVPDMETLHQNPGLPDTVLSDFRRLAAARGVALPETPENNAILNAVLLRELVLTRDGAGALLSLQARFDPEVRDALDLLQSREEPAPLTP